MEPRSFSKAIKIPVWKEAMVKEMAALKANNTWITSDLPPGMTGARVSSFPLEQQLKLRSTDGSPLSDPTPYRCLIGHLIYLIVTHPDISYAVNNLSQFMKSPHTTHINAANRVLLYRKKSIGKGLFLFDSSSLHITGFSGSDWERCPTSRRSTSEYYTLLGSSPFS
ncbi:uncharacterized protein LOC113350896 [Papaver somniferum]|uniref:uncharacterized protein LOC113350896 n=1 Tax=Papaver somniferum TaxID=3469 RepID=UPI000E6FCDE4|nr:uncharacterized protein LOC113350896 [Papaver somniferum]